MTKRLAAALSIAALASAASLAHGAPAAETGGPLFDRHTFSTGLPAPQTVLAGRFAGARTEQIAVAHVAANGSRQLRLFGFDGAVWRQTHAAAVRRDAAFVDVLRLGDQDRLILYGNGAVTWFDPSAGTERPLAKLPGSYKRDPEHLPAVDVTRDVNLDGREDLVLPDLDGFAVAITLPDGSFAAPVKRGPPEPFLDATSVWEAHDYRRTGITSWTVPWYQSRLHALDYDRDGRGDLAFWNGGRFDLYRQIAPGAFAAEACAAPESRHGQGQGAADCRMTSPLRQARIRWWREDRRRRSPQFKVPQPAFAARRVFHFVKCPKGYYYDADAVRSTPKRTKVVNGAVVTASGVRGVRYRRQIELTTLLSEREKRSAFAALDDALSLVSCGELADFRMIIRGQQRATHSDSERVSARAKELRDRGFYFLKYHPNGSKPSDVWDILPEDTQKRVGHFAPFPEDLCKVPILATSPPGGLVLDPFCGTGTTMLVASQLGRKSVGIDVCESYVQLADERTARLL